MKHVYVIMSGCYGDEGIREIYSSKKKAQEALDRMYADKYDRQGEPWIEKWEVK